MESAKDRVRRRRAAHLLLASFVAASPALSLTGCSRFRDQRRPPPQLLGKEVAVPGASLAGKASGPVPIEVAEEHGRDLQPKTSRPVLVGDLIDVDAAEGSPTFTRSTAHPSRPPAAGPIDAPTPSALVDARRTTQVRAASTAGVPNPLPPIDLPEISTPKVDLPKVELPPVLAQTPDTTSAPGVSPMPELAPPTEDNAKVLQILAEARAKLDKIGNYQVDIRRQERVGSELLPIEEFRLSILRGPKAIRLEWPSGPNKGREVLYTANAANAKMHVRMPNPLIPRISLAPDSPMASRNSRHPITEAGFDTILDNVEGPAKSNDPANGIVKLEGVESPQEVGRACYLLTRVTPQGESWKVYLDTTTSLPAMVVASDPQGQLLERYIFNPPKVDLPELASLDAFDPDKRWGGGSGFLGRLARGSGATPAATSTQ